MFRRWRVTTVAVTSAIGISVTNDTTFMENNRSITIRGGGSSFTVARDELTGIEAYGDSVPTALYTLSEKLEIELLK